MKASFFISGLFVLATFLLASCEKDVPLVPGNQAPNDVDYVSTIQIRNYVNRAFIDLLGREPLAAEMELEVELLKGADLSEESRIALITKLQSDMTYIEGDSSYKHAYYQRFYEIVKVRMIEGVEDAYFWEDLTNFITTYDAAVASGDSATAGEMWDEIQGAYDVWDIPKDYREGEIEIGEVFFRLINNHVYDKINMNTFNFINATFDNLYYRFPTEEEYNTAFDMIEYEQAGSILGMVGTNRGDYMNIVTSSRAFYEGLISWQFRSLVLREPTGDEINDLMSSFYVDHDFQAVQLAIMITDEYAGF